MAVSKKKGGRNLILLLILMIVMIGTLVWLTNHNKQKVSSEADKGEDTSVIATADTTAINTIHFSIPDNEMTLVLNVEGTWVNYLDEKFPVNQTYASNMASAFASISATRTITENMDDLSEFGLKEPVASISATLKDGSVIAIKLGSKVPVTGGYYATLNDDGKVYIISDTFYSTFNYSEARMTEVETIPVITAENITELSIENQDKQSFEVIYDEASPVDLSGFSNYIINKAYSTPVPADSDAITTLFGNYSEMSFTSCVEYNASDLSKYDLDKPSSQIRIAYYEEVTQDTEEANTTQSTDTSELATEEDNSTESQATTKVNHELTLFIGGLDENGDYYAKLSDSNAVNIISASTVSTLTDIAAYDNTYKYVNLINIDAVNSIDINVEDATYHLTIKRETKTIDGEESQVATYYMDDKEMEEDAFKTLYQVIIGTVTEREIPQDRAFSSDAPYMTVTYHLVATDESLVIKYLPYDQSFYAVNTNGIQYFLTDMRKITEIAESLKTAK